MINMGEQRRYDSSRDEHLLKSQAFLQEASSLLRTDLVSRSALADAVSAIKHSLQAYLWSRVGSAPSSEQRQRWQEIALDGSMPKLLDAAAAAGMKLGDYDRKIRDLASVRNARTHDSPQNVTPREQAASAVQIADALRKTVVAALAGKPATVVIQDKQELARAVPPPRSAMPDSSAKHATPWVEAGGKQKSDVSPPAPAEPQPPRTGPTKESAASLERQPKQQRLWWIVGIAAALILGMAAGSAVTYPVASGHVPSWAPFAAALAPATPTATVQPTATAAATSGPLLAGDLAITPSACGATPMTLVLRNDGAAAVTWAAGSPDAPAARLALSAAGDANPTATGHLAPGASATLYVTGAAVGSAHVVVIADGGTVSALLRAC